jgi:mono/diheme cytochrome c family protein
MRRLFRILLRVLAVFVLLIVAALAVVYFLTERRMARTYQVTPPPLTVPTDEAAVKRGERLARVVVPCWECHGEDYGGQLVSDNFAMGRLAAANLTRGRGGIGATYTDADWARVMVHGVRRDGRSAIFMPSHELMITAADLGDMVAYIRSLPPVDREMPPIRVGPMARILSYVGFPLLPAEFIDHQSAQFKTPPKDDSVLAQGRHLADTACGSCHKPDYTGGSGPPPGASNITPAGIGGWSEADFVRALREHVRPNGTEISEAMPRVFGQLSDTELHAIYTFLQTVPAKGEKTKRQVEATSR